MWYNIHAGKTLVYIKTAKPLEAQDYPWLHSKFESSLEYVRLHSETNSVEELEEISI